MVDGIIAPTRKQRERYSSWLHIYGKQKAKITTRMAGLVEQYEASDFILSQDIYVCSVFVILGGS
jgi:hypothetical protein